MKNKISIKQFGQEMFLSGCNCMLRLLKTLNKEFDMSVEEMIEFIQTVNKSLKRRKRR
jgi:hypothetical protein